MFSFDSHIDMVVQEISFELTSSLNLISLGLGLMGKSCGVNSQLGFQSTSTILKGYNLKLSRDRINHDSHSYLYFATSPICVLKCYRAPEIHIHMFSFGCFSCLRWGLIHTSFSLTSWLVGKSYKFCNTFGHPFSVPSLSADRFKPLFYPNFSSMD